MSHFLELNKTNILEFLIDRIDTPIGEMILVADREGNLRATDWTDHEGRMQKLLCRRYGRDGFTLTPARNPSGLSDSIRSYFAGDLTAIDRLPVQTGGTPFQREVWLALRKIACGATVSYAKLAEQIGRPSAVRAVGLANGSLTGYGGGMERKRWLLQHESPRAPSLAQFAVGGM